MGAENESAQDGVEIIKSGGAVVVVQTAAGAGAGSGSGGTAKDGSPATDIPAERRARMDRRPEDEETQRVTQHVLHVGDRELRYTARTGFATLATEAGKTRAQVFFVAYTLDGVDDVSKRPITFAFNGGPGSSSVWLHMGAFGPRRIPMPDDASPPATPGVLEDNLYTLLGSTDLVFIDPVSTGFSRAAKPADASSFHAVNEDVASVGEFIRLYTTRSGRWSSPKFLAGESYGTTRAAALAEHLQSRHGMYLSGIALISMVLDFQTLAFNPGNDLPHILFVPTYAATAWYHGRVGSGDPAELPTLLEQAEAFALGEYSRALLLGDRLNEAERRAVAERLATLTGVDADYVERSNLRLRIDRFVKELRRDERTIVGRLDSRYIGHDADAAGESNSYDPSYAAIQGPYTAALNHYVRHDLGFESDLPYEILTDRVRPWTYDESDNRYLNVAPRLRQAMNQNKDLRVFVACGYYDLATPHLAAKHTLSHLGLEPALRENIEVAYYPAGHMMYIHEPSHAALAADLDAFYLKAAGIDGAGAAD